MEIKENTCKIKFLREDLENFVWPRSDDIQEIDNKYLFYGPINILGSNPFQIKRYDRISITKIYKKLKRY